MLNLDLIVFKPISFMIQRTPKLKFLDIDMEVACEMVNFFVGLFSTSLNRYSAVAKYMNYLLTRNRTLTLLFPHCCVLHCCLRMSAMD